MASHLFIKPHRHTPDEDSIWKRISDALYVRSVGLSNMLSDAIESRLPRRKRR